MTGQIVLRSSPSITNRRQPLLSGPPPNQKHPKPKSNVGEIAGVTTANICVVCCCCPFVVVEFIILAVYKVPMNVVRRILKKRKRNRRNVQVVSEVHHLDRHRSYVDEFLEMDMIEFEKIVVSIDGSESMELDNRMWERFRDAGFWHSSN